MIYNISKTKKNIYYYFFYKKIYKIQLNYNL